MEVVSPGLNQVVPAFVRSFIRRYWNTYIYNRLSGFCTDRGKLLPKHITALLFCSQFGFQGLKKKFVVVTLCSKSVASGEVDGRARTGIDC